MSWTTWSIYGYGIDNTNVPCTIAKQCFLMAEAPKFLENFLQKYGDEDNVADLMKYCKKHPEASDEEITDKFHLDNDDFHCMLESTDTESGDNAFYGIISILAEVIYEKYRIAMTACDDFDGTQYLIYEPRYPWAMTEIDKTMTTDKLYECVAEVLKKITDLPVLNFCLSQETLPNPMPKEYICFDSYHAENGG